MIHFVQQNECRVAQGLHQRWRLVQEERCRAESALRGARPKGALSKLPPPCAPFPCCRASEGAACFDLACLTSSRAQVSGTKPELLARLAGLPPPPKKRCADGHHNSARTFARASRLSLRGCLTTRCRLRGADPSSVRVGRVARGTVPRGARDMHVAAAPDGRGAGTVQRCAPDFNF